MFEHVYLMQKQHAFLIKMQRPKVSEVQNMDQRHNKILNFYSYEIKIFYIIFVTFIQTFWLMWTVVQHYATCMYVCRKSVAGDYSVVVAVVSAPAAGGSSRGACQAGHHDRTQRHHRGTRTPPPPWHTLMSSGYLHLFIVIIIFLYLKVVSELDKCQFLSRLSFILPQTETKSTCTW